MKRRWTCQPVILSVLTLSLCLILPDSMAQTTARSGSLEPKAERWAFIIGVSRYKDPNVNKFSSALPDAKRLAQVLKEHGGFEHVILLTDDAAPTDAAYPSLDHVKSALDHYGKFIQPNDLLFFALFSHGVLDAKGSAYLLMSETTLADLEGSALPLTHLTQFIEKKGIKRSILFADVTRDSFAKGRVASIRPLDPEEISWGGIGAVMLSTQKGLYAYDVEIDRQGVFSKYLVNGLRGEADRASMGNGDGMVALQELVAYIQEGIFKWSLREQKRQMPFLKMNQAGMEALTLASVERVHHPEAPAKAQVPDKRSEDQKRDERALALDEEKREKEALIMSGNSVKPSSLRETLPEGERTPTIHPLYLRRKPKNLSPSDVGEMLKRYHFYATCWNANGDFCNPEGNFENHFVDNRNGTISDRATGLMWQKAGSSEPLTWVEAKKYVQKMNGFALAGYTDWRLPTIEELASLLETSWLNGDLFIDPVFEKKQRHCWSLDPNGKNNAWKTNFHLGFVLDLPMHSRSSVRLVRSLK